MKRQWGFLALCLVAAVTLFVTYDVPEKAVAVSTQTLTMQSIEQTVTCSGVVESGETRGVFAPLFCVVAEVLVDEGQAVSAGDALLRIDKEATRAAQSDRVSEALPLLAVPQEITAPTDGIVLSVEVAVGDAVDKAFPCVLLAAQENRQVRIAIREKWLPSLRVGQAVRVSGAGFDKDLYRGSLSEISSTASTNSANGERLVEGLVVLESGEADASMRLGLSAKAKIVVSTVDNGVVIPYEAVVQEEDGDRYVFLADNQTAVKCPITPLEELSDGILVDTEQFAGRRLILQPEAVTDGSAIIEQEATK